MKYVAPLAVMLLLFSLTGCGQETAIDRYQESFDVHANLTGSEYLDALYQDMLELNGPATTYAHGEIVDDENNRLLFPYSDAMANVTGLDFVQLATIQFYQGLYGVDQVVDHLEPTNPGLEQAEYYQSLRTLTTSLYYEEAAIFLESLEDATLSTAEAQNEIYVTVFLEAWNLMVPGDPIALNEAYYPQAAECAELTGLDFEVLATVQQKGGTNGLQIMIDLFPELENREECLATFETTSF